MAISLGAALIGSAVIGAGSSAIAGSKASKAQRKAANAQIEEERRQYDQTRTDFAPWREAGGQAIGKLASVYGLNTGAAGEATPGGVADSGFFTSPGYEFRRDEAMKAVDRGASARGLRNSGARDKAIIRQVDGMASGEYGDWWNRLAGIAGVGQSAANSTAAAGQSATQGITAAQQQIGNARASSYANTASSINSGINNVLGAYLYNRGNPGGVGRVPGFGG